MPTFRPDLEQILYYDPGKPIEEVARELGIDDIVKLASNESPTGPFPEVQAAIAAATPGINRYPETTAPYLAEALAATHRVEMDQIWVGAGSTGILVSIAMATTRAGTSAVFADPSFVVYPIGTAMSGGSSIRVGLDADHRHDLVSMAGAVRDDTVVLYVCNPNNPTGTHSSARDIDRLLDLVPDRVLVVVDEAYAEYVTAPDYATAIPHATARDNVVVTRTFSKVYGLAGLRVGYAIGQPDTIRALRRTQVPFATTTLSQVAAIESLQHPDRVAARIKDNAIGRELLTAGLRKRELFAIDSQTNFVLFRSNGDARVVSDALLQAGVIVRPMGPWIRVSVGTDVENRRFLAALDDVMEAAT